MTIMICEWILNILDLMIPISLHDSIVKLSVVQCYIIMEFPRLVSGAQPPPDFPMTQCSGLGTGLLCAAALYYTLLLRGWGYSYGFVVGFYNCWVWKVSSKVFPWLSLSCWVMMMWCEIYSYQLDVWCVVDWSSVTEWEYGWWLDRYPGHLSFTRTLAQCCCLVQAACQIDHSF